MFPILSLAFPRPGEAGAVARGLGKGGVEVSNVGFPIFEGCRMDNLGVVEEVDDGLERSGGPVDVRIFDIGS